MDDNLMAMFHQNMYNIHAQIAMLHQLIAQENQKMYMHHMGQHMNGNNMNGNGFPNNMQQMPPMFQNPMNGFPFPMGMPMNGNGE
jgi:hypothetical protein